MEFAKDSICQEANERNEESKNGVGNEEEERLCRYCFDDDSDEELISPCQCRGGQQFVHLSCLRRWQRMVLVSQPTHPAFYEDDERHHKCNVCLSEYTCPPPTRGELMESFTGPEIAALLMKDRIICSRDIFSDALERQLEGMPEAMRQYSSYEHWVKGTYLIYSVEEDKSDIILPVTDQSSVSTLLSRLNDDLEVTLHGRTYRLVAEKSLGYLKSTITTDDDQTRKKALREGLRTLCVPGEIVLSTTMPITSADDSIAAVNICRQITGPVRRAQFENIVDKIAIKYPRVRQIQIQHFIGGPVEESEIAMCIVTGSTHGWTYVSTLEKALLLSLSRSSQKKFGEAQGGFGGGQVVEIHGLKGRVDLNGKVGLTARFVPNTTEEVVSGRWEVLLPNGEGVRVKPANLKAAVGEKFAIPEPARVMVFWGVARWTRAQLLGEIARGHWGLCRASCEEFILSPKHVWPEMVKSSRLVYAPHSDMTDELVNSGEAQRQMEAVSRVAQLSTATSASEDRDDVDPSQEEEEVAEMESRL